MGSRQELNKEVNYTASRELVARDEHPLWPLKNETEIQGLSVRDIEILDKLADIMYETKLPLSVLMMDKNHGLPSFNQWKALIDEKCKCDGFEFYDSLEKMEYDIVWGSLWKDAVVAEDAYDIRRSQILMGMLGNKMKRLETKREEYNDNRVTNIFLGADPKKLKSLKEALVGDVIDGDKIDG